MAKKEKKSPDEKLLKRALDRLKLCVDSDEHNRKSAIEDLNFVNGEQWDGKERSRREKRGRPVLTINQLPKYIKQGEGDLRQNKPRIKVRPLNSQATPAIANIREGLIRRILYDSRAEAIFDQAGKMQMTCGYGAWRVLTRYKDNGMNFNQEAYLQLIKNPFAVYIDPDCMDMSKGDAKYAFVFDKMSKDEFEKKYPKADQPWEKMKTGKGIEKTKFYDKDTESVIVAEYYEKQIDEYTICLLSDDRVMSEKEAKAEIEARDQEIDALTLQNQSMPPDQIATELPLPLEIKRERTCKEEKIVHYVIDAVDVLEGPNDVAGKYIPIVLALGEELNVEGKDFVQSLIRFAKDPQQLFNYWTSSGAESIALAPKAPYIGTVDNFKGFTTDWADANVENHSFLQYNPDPMNNGQAPQRNQAQQAIPAGIFQEIAHSEQYIKDAVGMYGAGFEAPGNERSKGAVLARRMPSDAVTFIYIDNHSRAVEHTGRILNDIIPIIYDTEQDALVRTSDNVDRFVPINTTAQSAAGKIKENPDLYSGMDIQKLDGQIKKHGGDSKFNDIGQGEYMVTVEVGPSYQTQRMEAVETMIRLVQYMPLLGKIAPDLIVGNMDFTEAEEIARRLRKSLPPGMVPPDPSDGPPMPPPPQMIAMMKKIELDQEKVKAQQAKTMLELARVAKETGQSKKQIIKEVLDALGKMGAIGALAAGIQGQNMKGRR